MTRRRLTPDEIALWRKVARSTEKLHPDRGMVSSVARESEPSTEKRASIDPFEIGQKTGETRPVREQPSPARPTQETVRMDRKSFGKLKRGKLKPEARIDLHGMTIDQAHPALMSFIMREHAKGRRLVLVITGKGRVRDEGGPIPVRPGVLRQNLPHWLSTPPLSQLVLQVTDAHLKHGGGGAFYVYLRRPR
ncbi:Smr/MutS family protein [Roseovarius sp. SYSU LYC5161]|uniref:Smr/MutS family protein n=1 Tax=Roseovarius halophilus (ex Wu et al. 2025) TaxID=3376060 RepID=UPI00399A39FF